MYYNLSWVPLQLLLAKVLVGMFTLGGHSASHVSGYLTVDNFVTRIDSDCTYIDLILVALPFVYRGDRLFRDATRVLFFVVMVSALNIARVYFAIAWHLRGVPWQYTHDLISNLTYYPVFVLIIFWWLEAMRLRLTRKSKVITNEEQR